MKKYVVEYSDKRFAYGNDFVEETFIADWYAWGANGRLNFYKDGEVIKNGEFDHLKRYNSELVVSIKGDSVRKFYKLKE